MPLPMMAATMAASTAATRMVSIMEKRPFLLGRRLNGAEGQVLLVVPVLPEQHVEDARQEEEGDDRPDAEGGHAADEAADLVDDHGGDIGEAAHVADGAQGPLPVVHL